MIYTFMERKDEMNLGSLLQSGPLYGPSSSSFWGSRSGRQTELWIVTAEGSCANNVADVVTFSSPYSVIGLFHLEKTLKTIS